MIYFWKNGVFFDETLHVLNFLLLYCLDRHSFHGASVFRTVHNSEATMAYIFLECILVLDVSDSGFDKLLLMDYQILVEPSVNFWLI